MVADQNAVGTPPRATRRRPEDVAKLIGVFLFMAALTLGAYMTSSAQHAEPVKAEPVKHTLSASTLKEIEQTERDLAVELWRWELGGYINDARWTVTIRNRGKVAYGNVRYSTVYVVPSGPFVGGKEGTIPGVLLPGKSVTLEINTGEFPHDMFGTHPAQKASYEGGAGRLAFHSGAPLGSPTHSEADCARDTHTWERFCLVTISAAKPVAN
jgi:hypothetical protein